MTAPAGADAAPPELFPRELLEKSYPSVRQCQKCGRICLTAGLLGVFIESVLNDIERDIKKPTVASLLRFQRGLQVHLSASYEWPSLCGFCSSHRRAEERKASGWNTSHRLALDEAACALEMYVAPPYQRIADSVRADLRGAIARAMAEARS